MADDSDILNRKCDEAHEDLKRLFQCLRFYVEAEGGEEKVNLYIEAGLNDKFSKLVDSIAKLKSRVEEVKVTIAFLGHSSAGKSTTLNCLLRRDLLQTSSGHTTPCPTTIEPTDNKSSSYRTSHGRKGDLPNPSKENLKGFLDLDSKDVFELFLCHEHCKDTVLESKWLKLVDFPGWNGSTFEDAASVIQNADIVVFITDRASGTDQREIVNFLQRMKDSSMESKKSVFLVFNKMDVVLKDSKETYEQLCETIYREAEKILITDTEFLQGEDDVRRTTFLFSATDAALVRSNHSTSDLERALIRDAESGKLGQVVCCGSRGVGKTSLCNLLLRSLRPASLLPTSPDSAVCWVVCCRPDDTRTFVKVGADKSNQAEALPDDQSLEDALLDTEEHIMRVHPASDLIDADSFLYKCDQLVDSLSSDNTKFVSFSNCLGEAPAVILIVNCDKPESVKRQIQKYLKLITEERNKLPSTLKGQNQTVYLVVNLRKKNTDDEGLLQLKETIRGIFSDLAIDLQSRERSIQRVFFMALEDLSNKEKFADGFGVLEKRLRESATTGYIELKIGNLKNVINQFAKDFDDLFSKDLKTYLEKVQEACSHLKDIKAKVGDSKLERQRFADRFIEEYRDKIRIGARDNYAYDTCSVNSGDSASPLLERSSTEQTQSFVPQTSKEKQQFVEQFFQSLLKDPFGDKSSNDDDENQAGNGLLVNNVLGHFNGHPARNFVQRLCKQAENKVLEKLFEIIEEITEKVKKKARIEFRTPPWLKKFVTGIVGVTGVAGGVAGTSIVASEAAVAALGGLAATAAAGFAAIGVAAAVVVGGGASGIAYAILCHSWPSFNNEEELKRFLEIFHETWFSSFEEHFNRFLQDSLPDEQKRMSERATEIQNSMSEFNREFLWHKQRVPLLSATASNAASFDLII